MIPPNRPRTRMVTSFCCFVPRANRTWMRSPGSIFRLSAAVTSTSTLRSTETTPVNEAAATVADKYKAFYMMTVAWADWIEKDKYQWVADYFFTPAIAAGVNRGFTSNGRESKVSIFDTKTLKLIEKVDVGKSPDGIYYDAGSKRVSVPPPGRPHAGIRTVVRHIRPRMAPCAAGRRRTRRSAPGTSAAASHRRPCGIGDLASLYVSSRLRIVPGVRRSWRASICLSVSPWPAGSQLSRRKRCSGRFRKRSSRNAWR